MQLIPGVSHTLGASLVVAGPALCIALRSEPPPIAQLRDAITRIGGTWHGDGDFSFGTLDPSPFVLGTEPSEFDPAEVAALREHLRPVPESIVVVGAMGNGEQDHFRLAKVAGELAGVLGGVIFVESPTRLPAYAAKSGWSVLIEQRSLGRYWRYAMEAAVLLHWAEQPSFRLIK